MENLIEKLPPHLQQYVCYQDYSKYTNVNQAVWRYVMRQNLEYLPAIAHESYVEGLKKTGISPDRIPSMHGMNRILKEIGWAALAVDGFIPPNAFMEFQAYQILVIAQDIRKVEHIKYTPAPDIIHEAAGHAPIIANPAYSEYLRRFGAIGSKAIGSKVDWDIYHAIRHLSIIKEYENAKPADVSEAEERLNFVLAKQSELSELAMVRNLHWWTVEYGLIGTLENPKIYGAGLLSSIGESKSCLRPEVRKLPYDVSASKVSYDITNTQPHLFVTPDFPYLSFVLEQFANTLSIRKGGRKGLERLIDSGQLGTIELNTGVQISGVFGEMILNEDDEVIYFKTSGPTALAYHDKELVGHGTTTHFHGFGSPVGKLKNINIPIEEMSPYDLEAYGIKEDNYVKLEFEGGISIDGKVITGIRNLYGKIILISFTDCTVKFGEKILFDRTWGQFDMVIGSFIKSAFAGAADTYLYPVLETHKIESSPLVTSGNIEIEGYFKIIQDYYEKVTENKSLLIEILEKIKPREFTEKSLLLSELKNLGVF